MPPAVAAIFACCHLCFCCVFVCVYSVYEAAAAAVGSDYTSGLLWDKYLAYEATQGVPSAVAALYARALKCPVKDLDKYHTG